MQNASLVGQILFKMPHFKLLFKIPHLILIILMHNTSLVFEIILLTSIVVLAGVFISWKVADLSKEFFISLIVLATHL